MGDEEIKQHEIPLDTLLTESVTRAIDRLIRFLTRFVELGNEKNNMIRQYPSHGSCISGHTVKVSIELRNEEDDFDSINEWKTLVCDSNTTIGEFKVRLAKRLVFHENMTEFTVQKTDDDMILQETSLRYDYLTFQSVHLATESESIFYSEKFRILVKPRSRPSRKFEPKKAIHEMYLPAALVSYCNMIKCLLPFCTQEQTERCAQDFLKVVMSKFLFPEQLDIEELMFEEESTRWESYCRDAAIFTVTMFCERSYKNMKIVLQDLEKFPIFHRDYDANYKACVTPRNFDQVGMKNDGGTCYMNATIQQLVHVPGLAQKLIAIQNIDPTLKCGQATAALLSEVQKLFATLVYSRAQYCFPVGLWNEFRFDPDVPLNTKQHHDAIDFYSILLDHCDSVLKKIDCPQLFKEHLFGKYSYEKICYGCWHRYESPDEEFNCVSLALHGDNLEEALDNFLEPHLMEGENAYHCEKCNEKKTTLNRGSFLELPPTLTIQLKRFTYDFINNSIQKDNQFFKFPFGIDMQPYTTNARHVPDEQVQDLFDEMLYSSNEDKIMKFPLPVARRELVLVEHSE